LASHAAFASSSDSLPTGAADSGAAEAMGADEAIFHDGSASSLASHAAFASSSDI